MGPQRDQGKEFYSCPDSSFDAMLDVDTFYRADVSECLALG